MKALSALTALLLFGHSSEAYAQCDAELVRAFKSEYSFVTDNTVDEAIYSASCKRSGKATSTAFNVSVPKIGSLGFSMGGKTIAQACYEKDMSFFSRHRSAIAQSALPPSAIQPLLVGCFGGLSLSVSVLERQVQVRAAYASEGGGGELAKVQHFDVFRTGDAKSVTCKPPVLRKGETLIPGGRTTACDRGDGRSGLSIVLNTDKGERSVWVSPEPKIEIKLTDWSYNGRGYKSNKGGPNTQCMTESGPVGGPVDCRNDGTCGNAMAIRGLCMYRHGLGTVTVNGSKVPNHVNWGYETSSQSAWTQCTLNGHAVGPKVNCQDDKTCGKPNAIIGMCVARHYQKAF